MIETIIVKDDPVVVDNQMRAMLAMHTALVKIANADAFFDETKAVTRIAAKALEEMAKISAGLK